MGGPGAELVSPHRAISARGPARQRRPDRAVGRWSAPAGPGQLCQPRQGPATRVSGPIAGSLASMEPDSGSSGLPAQSCEEQNPVWSTPSYSLPCCGAWRPCRCVTPSAAGWMGYSDAWLAGPFLSVGGRASCWRTFFAEERDAVRGAIRRHARGVWSELCDYSMFTFAGHVARLAPADHMSAQTLAWRSDQW